MSTHHAKLLRSIFHDPPGHNIRWRDVESLLGHVGAAIEPLSGSRVKVTKDHVEAILYRPHHHSNELDKQGLVHLRELLARLGVTPSSYEAS